MAILHTINQSPGNSRVWHKMLSLLSPGDSLLLIEDAVYACVQDEIKRKLDAVSNEHAVNICVLEQDAIARGLPTPTPWTMADYTGFVSLATKTDKTISWCAE